jgi:N-acetylneuraminate synthase
MRTKIIAEIGINHNGSMEIAKSLIDVASVAGCDFVKFQKRNPDICVPEEQKNKMRETPWGEMTYLDYKWKTEFDRNQYAELFKYCEHRGIEMFASVWDKDSVDFMRQFTKVMKIPSALITNLDLVEYARSHSDFLMISTGMSTEDEITRCVEAGDPSLIFHTNSSYPSPVEDLNLNYIDHLKETYPDKEIGYSGHEFGLVPSYTAVVKGASWIERHVTLDRTMWGSDQMASVEPHGLIKLVKDIRSIEASLGKGGRREVFESELSKRKSLRG